MSLILLPAFFVLYGCKSLKVEPSPQEKRDSHWNIYKESLREQNLREGTLKRIDSLIEDLFNSKYTLCHFHTQYNERHDYSKLHHSTLDELAFYSGYSLIYERYIFHKFIRNYQKPGSNGEKWKNCLMLFPKKDCGDGDYEHRLNYIARMKLDTTSIKSTEEFLSKLIKVLEEPCAETILHMQNEHEWRARFYQSIINQTESIYQTDEDLDYEIHELLLNLKDSLSSRFAYDYIMENVDLPDGISDIIEDRFMDWKKGNGYTRIQGPSVLYSEKEIRELIDRAEEIKKLNPCDWCDDFILRLKLRFN